MLWNCACIPTLVQDQTSAPPIFTRACSRGASFWGPARFAERTVGLFLERVCGQEEICCFLWCGQGYFTTSLVAAGAVVAGRQIRRKGTFSGQKTSRPSIETTAASTALLKKQSVPPKTQDQNRGDVTRSQVTPFSPTSFEQTCFPNMFWCFEDCFEIFERGSTYKDTTRPFTSSKVNLPPFSYLRETTLWQ